MAEVLLAESQQQWDHKKFARSLSNPITGIVTGRRAGRAQRVGAAGLCQTAITRAGGRSGSALRLYCAVQPRGEATIRPHPRVPMAGCTRTGPRHLPPKEGSRIPMRVQSWTHFVAYLECLSACTQRHPRTGRDLLPDGESQDILCRGLY